MFFNKHWQLKFQECVHWIYSGIVRMLVKDKCLLTHQPKSRIKSSMKSKNVFFVAIVIMKSSILKKFTIEIS